jgi:cation diffusion facilitator family transporter
MSHPHTHNHPGDDHDHDHHAHTHHQHDHHSHDHSHEQGIVRWVKTIFHLHEHSHQHQHLATDPAFAHTNAGIRTVWIALGLLMLTSILQVGIVAISGSVALLADTIHNIGDGLNSVPLLIAFYLARRAATRRYTYGFGRAEDVAGVLIVVSIAFSAGYILWESVHKLIDPQPLTNLGWVAVAALIGFLGNEGVALLQIRVGRTIGSDALVADGLHARTDGLTSLAVLLAAGGTALGFPIVDPLIGLLIGVVIVLITRDAARTIWYRLMDAMDPTVVEQLEQTAQAVPGVEQVQAVRARWVGHQMHATLEIIVDEDVPVRESHQIVEAVQQAVQHGQSHLARVTIQIHPCGHSRSIQPAPDAEPTAA